MTVTDAWIFCVPAAIGGATLATTVELPLDGPLTFDFPKGCPSATGSPPKP